jgi:hypothetical protein
VAAATYITASDNQMPSVYDTHITPTAPLASSAFSVKSSYSTVIPSSSTYRTHTYNFTNTSGGFTNPSMNSQMTTMTIGSPTFVLQVE